MFKNYLSVALRHFFRNKIFTAINIAGLAIGISAALVIYLIVQFEFSYDSWIINGDRIYRVVTNMHFPDQDFKNGGVPGPLPASAREEIPEIEKSTAFLMSDGSVTVAGVSEEDKVFKNQDKIGFVDPYYFQMLDYQWLTGDPGDALTKPNQVVLTESRARTYFPYQDITRAVGRTLYYDDTLAAVVSGIVKDLTVSTSFQFKEFVSFSSIEPQWKKEQGGEEWGNVSSSFQYLVLLKQGSDPAKVNTELASMREKHKGDAYLATDHILQPLRDIHFNNEFDSIHGSRGHKPTLYGLLAVAIFLLLLGCINFVNLSTGQSTQRAKEIGIRKTMGSTRGTLRLQFLTETFLLTLIATVLSLVITPLIIKIFSGFIPEGLTFELANQPELWLFILVELILVSLAAGFYPAIVLSHFQPVTVLKNAMHSNGTTTRGVWIRKSLMVAQFMIAQFFIIATLIVGKQIRYSMNKDMGFRKDAIIYFYTPFKYRSQDQKQLVLYDKLQALPGLENISLAGAPPASNGTSSTTMEYLDDGKDIETTIEIKYADTNYFKLYDIKLLAGRNLLPSDTLKEYVINESLARFLGYADPDQMVGKNLKRSNKYVPIVGVIADVNTKSVHEPIKPLAFCSQAKNHSTFHIAFSPGEHNTDQWKSSINAIEKAYKEVYPEEAFNYHFFDEDIAAFYNKEQSIAKLLNWSAGLTIFISCLGLFGLVLYTTSRRVKEIGVRKVLGATGAQIAVLLSKDLLRLVLVAFVLTAPIAWWIMHEWLINYAYRTQIGLGLILTSGVLMLVVAMLTLSTQTVRAARKNPADSLRSE